MSFILTGENADKWHWEYPVRWGELEKERADAIEDLETRGQQKTAINRIVTQVSLLQKNAAIEAEHEYEMELEQESVNYAREQMIKLAKQEKIDLSKGRRTKLESSEEEEEADIDEAREKIRKKLGKS